MSGYEGPTREGEPLVCPCGGTSFAENSRTGGWWKASLDGYGNTTETNLDGVRTIRPKTVTCEECGQRHPNPALAYPARLDPRRRA